LGSKFEEKKILKVFGLKWRNIKSIPGGPGPMGGEVIQGSSSVAPEGVFCQRPDIYRRRLPDMPDQFSVKIETVDEVRSMFSRHGGCGQRPPLFVVPGSTFM
jgi:hypothetical protein